MNKTNKILYFTESLQELLKENLTLFQALKIIGSSKLTDAEIKNTANYLAEEIEKGTRFSFALKKNEFMDFGNVYISFIGFAELTGNINEILLFLIEREKRRLKNTEVFVNALAYPLFIVFLILFLAFSVLLNGEKFLNPFFEITGRTEIIKKIILNLFVFVVSSVFAIKVLWKCMSEDSLYEGFLSGAFLYENGLSLPDSLGMAASITGFESKYGRMLISAKQKIECGMSIQDAFQVNNVRKFKKHISPVILLAEETGNKNMFLRKISSKLGKEIEKRRAFCMKFVEPVFILQVGVFMLSLVMNIILPLMGNMEII